MRPPTKDGDDMKTRISALMDSELDDDNDVAEALRALRRSEELRNHWSECQLIGAALRGESGLQIDVTARVMSAIESEPTVLAPPPRRSLAWQRPALALAASAAGVALVAWLALGSAGGGAPAETAELARTKHAPMVAQAAPASNMQEYLLAHQAYSPGGVIVGGARNVRVVAASGEGR